MRKTAFTTKLSINQVAALPMNGKNYSRTLGHGLRVRVNTKKKRKDFHARYFSPLAPKGKDIHIGTFGDLPNQITPFEAMAQWEEIKVWCDNQEKLPKDWTRQQKWNERFGEHVRTFNEVVDEFLSTIVRNQHIKETTLTEYRFKLDMFANFIGGGDDPINEFETSNDGRKKVQIALDKISQNKKFNLEHRVRSLAFRTFRFAINHEYMSGDNPVVISTDEKRRVIPNHHPTIEWHEVDQFIQALETNMPNMHPQVLLCSKLVLATGLRTGAAARLEWNWIDEDEEVIKIPGTTSGLKRNLILNDFVPHIVPITPDIQSLLDQAKLYSHDSRYIFLPTRMSRFEHLDPSSVNNLFRNLGYKGKFRAHGVRRLMLTAGQDVLKCEPIVIKKQLGHLPKGKVDKAYDGAVYLEERRNFLEKWCEALEEKGMRFE